MRPAPTLLFAAILGCLSWPAAAQVANLHVTDASAPGCPLHISGTVILAESIETSRRCEEVSATRCSVLSEQYEIAVRNVSHKFIVAFVAKMDGWTPNGNPLQGEWAQERIFGGPLFAPGQTENWPRGGNGEIRPQIAEARATMPRAEMRIVFAQFADGTIFGDVKAGEHLLLTRQTSLEAMARLDRIYTQQGEAAFLQALRQPNAEGLAGVAALEKQMGPEKAIISMRRALATAETRLAAMTAQPGR